MLDNILLVEDDEAMNYLSQLVLNDVQAAKTITVAEDGDRALTMLEEGLTPDLIFLDIRMPLMDGFEFLEALDALGSHQALRIAMLTSSLRPEDRTRAFRHSRVIEFLEKPLTEAAVTKVMHHLKKPMS